MSPLIRSILASALALPLTLAAQMSGTYTVDPAGGGNYTTIGAAVTALHTQGVSGPVTISIADGTYHESLVIAQVTGTSEVNTITFTSQNASASSVTIAPLTANNASGNGAILLDGADHVQLSSLTVDAHTHGIIYSGYVEDISVTDCIIRGSQGVITTGFGSAILTGVPDDIHIESCVFEHFRNAVLLAANAGERGKGVVIRETTIFSTVQSASGISTIYMDDVVIENNTIDLQAPLPSSVYYSHAVSVSSSSGTARIGGNQIVHGTGGEALVIGNLTNNAETPLIIENNMIRLVSTFGSGKGILVNNVVHTIVRHNTVRCDVEGSAVSYGGTGSTAQIIGNIFSTVSTTRAMYVNVPPDHLSEGNLFDVAGETVIGVYNAALSITENLTLEAWQAKGYDVGSRVGDPQFVSSTDLHIQPTSPAVGLAPYPATVALDMDGDVRPGGTNLFVEAGADELAVCSPMSGSYTISAVEPASFPSLNAAKNALYVCGISGPVVLSIAPGTYTEALNFDAQVIGSSATNTITFRSRSLDSASVVIVPPVSQTNMITIQAIDHLAFEHLTLERRNGQGSGIVSVNNGGAPVSIGVAFRHVRFRGSGLQQVSNELVQSASPDAQATTTFEHCTFENGLNGIKWTGASGEQLRITNCRFTDIWQNSVHVTGIRAGLLIEGNTFTSSRAVLFNMLKLTACNGAFKVRSNLFHALPQTAGDGVGILLEGCVATSNGRGVVSNNMVIGEGRRSFWGMQITGATSFVDVVHNSFSIENDQTAVAPLNITNTATGTNNRINNNIFSGLGCYAVYNNNGAAIGTLRNNLLHTTLLVVAFWNGPRASLASLQAASGQFNASMEADPLFVSNASDLHIQSGSPAIAAGHANTSSTTDFDGGLRPLPAATNPDIGADEIDQSAAFAPKVKRLDEVTDTDRVFPNPANEQLTITTDEPRSEHYRLLDLQGRITLEGMLDLPGTLDVTAVAPGTYLLMLGDHTNLTRIIVQH